MSLPSDFINPKILPKRLSEDRFERALKNIKAIDDYIKFDFSYKKDILFLVDIKVIYQIN